MLKPLNILFLSLLLMLFWGCGIIKRSKPAPSKAPKAPVKTVSIPEVKKEKGPSAVWYLFSHEQVTLHLKNIDSGAAISAVIENGLSSKSWDPGIWEITGFEIEGQTFVSMNTTKKFVFTMKPNSHTYAGSVIIGCPQVAPQDLKRLKNMGFFNRYPFNSDNGLCEMIVGNDFTHIRPEFLNSHKKGTKLILGF